MADYEIPLKAYAQHLSVAMNGITYQLTVRWNAPAFAWVVDIANINGANILTGIPLVTGTDLLGQFAHLGFGVSLYAYTDGDVTSPPRYDNLGITGRVYFKVT